VIRDEFAGQARFETHARNASNESDQAPNETHEQGAALTNLVDPATAETQIYSVDREDDQARNETQTHGVILEIQQQWRKRQDWLRAYNRLLLQSGAICRRWCKGSKTEGAELLEQLMSGDLSHPVAPAIIPLLVAIDCIRPELHLAQTHVIELAASLPVAKWCASVKGIGINGIALASIVGEAGDIGAYKSVAALWKRMGLAVINGERQRKYKDKKLAKLHGYNPSRRAQMYVLAESLFRAQSRCRGPYRRAYNERRSHTALTHPDWSKDHSHKDALRFMTKRFLRDFYAAWEAANAN